MKCTMFRAAVCIRQVVAEAPAGKNLDEEIDAKMPQGHFLGYKNLFENFNTPLRSEIPFEKALEVLAAQPCSPHFLKPLISNRVTTSSGLYSSFKSPKMMGVAHRMSSNAALLSPAAGAPSVSVLPARMFFQPSPLRYNRCTTRRVAPISASASDKAVAEPSSKQEPTSPLQAVNEFGAWAWNVLVETWKMLQVTFVRPNIFALGLERRNTAILAVNAFQLDAALSCQ